MRGVCTIVSVAIVGMLTGCGEHPDVTAAKEAIEKRLNDPAATQYRNVERRKNGTVCGEFNSRNRMGGYDGFREFYYRDGELHIENVLVKLGCLKEPPE